MQIKAALLLLALLDLAIVEIECVSCRSCSNTDCGPPLECCESGEYRMESPCGCCKRCTKTKKQTCAGTFGSEGSCTSDLFCFKKCECLTRDRKRKCIFPFTYKNVTYDGCTTDHVENSYERWCAYEVDEEGVVVDGKTEACNYYCKDHDEADDIENRCDHFSNVVGVCVDIYEKEEYLEKSPNIFHTFDSRSHEKIPFCNKKSHEKGQGADLQVCGIRDGSAKQVSGGSNYERWPWMVSLGFYTHGKWTHKCGGTIVHHKYILTAAHCVDEKKKVLDGWLARLGDFDLSANEPNEDVIAKKIKDVKLHPKYNNADAYFDVAVVTVDYFEYSEHILPICLPQKPSNSTYGQRSVVVAGWGSFFPGSDQTSPVIRTARLEVYPNEICNKSYGIDDPYVKRFLPSLLTTSLLCAGEISRVIGTCPGDSGGPLMLSDLEHGNYVQIGVVTGGFGGCGSGHFPTIFAKIDYYQNHKFIFDILNDQ